MSLKRLLTAATIALATAAITPAAAHANPPGISTETLTALTNLQPQTAWKLCHDGSTDVDTIITGESGDIQVWAKRGQDCKVAVRSERWLRYDRGGPTNGWRQLGRLRYADYAGDDHTITAVLAKGRTRLKIIQYVGPGW